MRQRESKSRRTLNANKFRNLLYFINVHNTASCLLNLDVAVSRLPRIALYAPYHVFLPSAAHPQFP